MTLPTDPALTTDGAGSPGATTGGATPAPQTADGRTFTQDDVDRVVKARLAEEQQRQDKARKVAADKAAEETARKAGEWQALADSATRERDRLSSEHETLTARHTALQEAAEAIVKDALKELPEAIRALAPGGDDLALRLAWIRNARKAAADLGAAPRTPGTPAGPRGTGGATGAQATNQDALLAQKRRQVGGL